MFELKYTKNILPCKEDIDVENGKGEREGSNDKRDSIPREDVSKVSFFILRLQTISFHILD